LERISDFLVVGKDVWWTSNEKCDGEFFDSFQTEVDSRVEGPRLHHFRSSNFKDEEEYLNEYLVYVSGKENSLTSSCVTGERCQ
jgi:hypothetical protein